MVARVKDPSLESHPIVPIGQPRPPVPNFKHGAAPMHPKREHNRRPSGRDTQGVLGQTVNNLPQPPRIGPHHDRPPRRLHPKQHPDRSAPPLPHLSGLGNQYGQVNIGDIKAKVISAKPSKIKQIGNESVEATGLLLDGPPNGRHLVPCDHPVGQGLGKPPNRGERRTQLVRHGKKELPLPRLTTSKGISKRVQRLANLDNFLGPYWGDAKITPPMTHPNRHSSSAAERSGKQPPKQGPSR